MDVTFRDILLRILTIIKYPNNKEKFIKEFEELNHMEAMTQMMERLPRETRKKMQKGDIVAEIKKYVNKDEYLLQVVLVSQKALTDFLAIMSTYLTAEQKQKISDLLLQS